MYWLRNDNKSSSATNKSASLRFTLLAIASEAILLLPVQALADVCETMTDAGNQITIDCATNPSGSTISIYKNDATISSNTNILTYATANVTIVDSDVSDIVSNYPLAYGINNAGVILNLFNNGLIVATATSNADASAVSTLVFSALATATSPPYAYGVKSTGSISNFVNNRSISATAHGAAATSQSGPKSTAYAGANAFAYGIQNQGNISNFVNYGTISATAYGTAASIGSEYTGNANANVFAYGIQNSGTIGSFVNHQEITANATSLSATGGVSVPSAYGLYNEGTIDLLVNIGTISAKSNAIESAVAYGVFNTSSGVIQTLTNIGAISGDNNDIFNQGKITTLNNGQGVYAQAPTSMPITYYGNLPNYYNTIISGNNYGQISVAFSEGKTIFGVSNVSNNIQTRSYSAVLSGVTSGQLINSNSQVYSFGKHAGLWLRPQAGNATTWDLVFQADRVSSVFLGYDDPNVVNTYRAKSSNRQATEGILHQRYAILNSVMQYDCNRYDKYGVCIQFQTRATGFGTQATGSGILNASYRIADKVRAGAYIDYQAFQGNPFGLNLGTGGVQQGYNNPTFGGYVGYSQSGYKGSPLNEGLQLIASGGYNPGQVSILRAVMNGTEPGYGNAGLNAYYANGVAGYGIKLDDDLIFMPYGGIQYTDITRNAYTEQANPITTIYPLAYNAYYERLITGLFGAKVQGFFMEKLGYQASMGAQVDFSRSANSYGGYSYVPGMEIFGIAHGGGWNGVRPAGMAGVFFDPMPNHRISVNGYASQQAWSTRTYTTGLLGYQIAF